MPSRFDVKRLKEPRVLMRAIMGTLLAANLGAAIFAFHPFGGGAEDLAREQESLNAQLTRLEARAAASKRLVNKVETARTAGDQFLDQYFMDINRASALIVDELYKTARAAGVQMGQTSFNRNDIEGSDTLIMLSANVGFEGTYANLTKFVNLLDKSPRFLIIENMNATAPQSQGGQNINVTLKIDAFIKDPSGAVL